MPIPLPESWRAHRAPWWLPGPHAQTLGGKLLRRQPPVALFRERWDTPDGDFLEVDFGAEPGNPPETGGAAPAVLLLHGLEGSSRRAYILQTMDALRRRGMLGIALNFRSCGGTPNRAPRFYHSGETGDLDFVVRTLARRFPDRPLAAIGFSLGGNVLIRWLGEQGAEVPDALRGAAAVSVPWDLSGGSRVLSTTPMGRFYTRYFMRSLHAKVALRRADLEDLVDVPAVLASRTLREFDELATAPLHGFEGAEDYYSRVRAEPVLHRIPVRTLLVQAADDPFQPPGSFPRAAVDRNPLLHPLVTPRGGHLGFVEGAHPLAPSFWVEETVARWLAATLYGAPGSK